MTATSMKTKVWKTIETGKFTKEQLLTKLSKQDVYVSPFAKELIEKMPMSEPETVELVKMTITELGFTKPTTWTRVLEKVKEIGDVCPPEAALLLRLADAAQKKGSWYYIAMEPITDSDGNPRVFYVERGDGGGRWLRAAWVHPDYEWNLDNEVVFRLRKSTLETEPLNPTLNSLTLKTLEARVARIEKLLTNPLLK